MASAHIPRAFDAIAARSTTRCEFARRADITERCISSAIYAARRAEKCRRLVAVLSRPTPKDLDGHFRLLADTSGKTTAAATSSTDVFLWMYVLIKWILEAYGDAKRSRAVFCTLGGG